MISNSAFYLDERFSTPTAYIRNWRKKGKSWEEIEHCCNIGIDNFLVGLNDADISITEDEWLALVTVLKEIEFNTYVGYIGDPQVPTKPISTNENSAWQKYKKKLIDNKFSAVSIDNIERASQKIVSQLGDSTEQFQPVRGMVVGNVQSGKTANMAGLIAMAEDYGYNFFIILSGTIDNLRRQTQERMVADLNSANCNLNLVSLSQLSGHTESGSRLQNLRLDEGDNTRYLYVCLKNTSRLNDLLVWINECKAKKSKLKVLVLDDEADQAGVNTANMSKDLVSKINRQIKALVFGQNSHFEDSTPYKSMNYIGYTATPYANFLNEANDLSAETNPLSGNTIDFLDFIDSEIEDPEVADLFSAPDMSNMQFAEIESIFKQRGKDIEKYCEENNISVGIALDKKHLDVFNASSMDNYTKALNLSLRLSPAVIASFSSIFS